MKFKTVLALMVVSLLFAGCANKPAESPAPNNSAQETTGMANPWEESDYEGVQKAIGFDMKAPEGSKNVRYFVNKSDGMGEIRFTYGDPAAEYTFRMQGTAEFKDISGLNYKWDSTEDGKVDRCEAKFMRVRTEKECTDLALWFDVVPGVMYSLSATAPDLDGFDISAIAEMMFVPTQDDVG